MKSNLLNLASLRGRKSPGRPTWGPRGRLTRREWLGTAGAAAVVASPGLTSISSLFIGSPEVLRSDTCVRFRLRGVDRWVIDPRRFGGRPKVSLAKQDGKTLVRLENSRFPGTELPSDFLCTVRPGLGGSLMQIRFTLAGLTGEVPFEQWLLGMVPVRLEGEARSALCRFPRGGELKLNGPVRASFFPSWTLNLSGNDLVTLGAPGFSLEADGCSLSIPESGLDSALTHLTSRRTLISLDRSRKRWSITPTLSPSKEVDLHFPENAFDSLLVEAAEPGGNERKYALLAESGRGGPAVTVRLRSALTASARLSGTLPLRTPRYALALQGSNLEGALLARFAEEPTWVSAGTLGLEVGDGPSAAPFEMHFTEEGVKSLICAPALHRTLVPLPDCIVEPARVMTADPVVLASAGPQGKVVQQKTQAKLSNPLLFNATLSLLRPEDLLKIDFTFVNLKLQGSAGAQQLVKDQGGKPSYLIATFPPQNIAERAFYEPPSDAADQLKDPPVDSLIAGPSRLVFQVPGDAAPIPYSLQGLLGACGSLPLSVNLHASALSKEQQKSISHLSSSRTYSPMKARAAAATLASASKRAKAGFDLRKSHQADLNALSAGTEELLQLPAGAAPAARTLKRVETLQNALERDAQLHPKWASEHAETLGDILQNVPLLELPPGAYSQILGAMLAMTKPSEPTPTVTAIELPYRLIVSPNALAGWKHSLDTVTWQNRIELWHTALGIRSSKGVFLTAMSQLRTLRAIWSPDYVENASDGPKHVPIRPFRMSLDQQDRHELVHLTSNFALSGFEPLPVQSDLLLLTSLGAWVNFHGNWIPPAGLSIEHWRQRGTMGRDDYVRVVYAGFLFPFGHKAALIKVTERKVQQDSQHQPVAYLRQRMYIVIKEREKSYPADAYQPHNARRFPFRKLRVTTLVTPDLVDPNSPTNDVAYKVKKPVRFGQTPSTRTGQSAFWPFVQGAGLFQFHMVGEDWEGRSTDFLTPVMFVDQLVAFDGDALDAVLKEYSKWEDRRKVSLTGQRIAFADPHFPGDTSHPSESITFGGELNKTHLQALASELSPAFYPAMESASIQVTSASQLAGKADPLTISYNDQYVSSGFGGTENAGEVYAEVVGGFPVAFDSDSKKSGGLITPSLNLSGLSRPLGVFAGDVATIRKGIFDAEKYFQETLSSAKFLGGIPLFSLIDKVPAFSGALEKVPKMVTEASTEYFLTTLKWNPKLRTSVDAADGSVKGVAGLFVPKSGASMSVVVEVKTPFNGSPPDFEVTSEVKNFALHLLPGGDSGTGGDTPEFPEFLILTFNRARFTLTPGEKPVVDVDIGALEFVGPLKFVNNVLSAVDKSGFSDPPFLDVSPSGIQAGYSLAIPNVAVGAFSLQNIALGALLELPFTGDPLNVGFNFCTRDNPFILTVSLFGGGGFFGVKASTHGLEKLEGSLEFGGSFALNLGVAKGGVVATGGFYYMKAGDSQSYEAHFRVSGGLAILGLITLSIEFYVGLTYSSNGKMEGEATVSVKIEIAFFSKSVSMTLHKQFKGDAGDPLFKDTVSQAEFTKYLGAFAA